MRTEFKFNFIVSFIIYAIVNFIGLYFSIAHGISTEHSAMGIMASILFILIPVTLYYGFGSKLKSLGTHIGNYLSVSSSLIFALIVTAYEHVFMTSHFAFQVNDMWRTIVNFSFGLWVDRITDMLGNFGFYAVAILPSLIMWGSLTLKTKRCVCENKSNS